jgi:HEAT repeat protein
MPIFGSPNIENLEKRGDFKGLIEALNYQEDPDVRGAAVLALGRIGGQNTFEPICSALQDDNKSVRARAAEALGTLGEYHAVGPLIGALEGSDQYPKSFQNALIEIFSSIEDETIQAEMIEKILVLLDSNDGIPQVVAATFVTHLVQNNTGHQYWGKIEQSLLQKLDSKNKWLQGLALDGLGVCIRNLKTDDLYLPIAKKLSHPQLLKQAGLREKAIQILFEIIEEIEDPELMKSIRGTIKHHLGDQRQEVRLLCAQILAKIGEEEDLSTLASQFIKDVKRPVQEAAVRAMARINSAKTSEILLQFIKSFSITEEQTSIYKKNWFGAVQVLGEIGEDWVVEPLNAIVKDDDFVGSPRTAAEEALKSITGKDSRQHHAY